MSLDAERASQSGIHIGAVVWLQVPRQSLDKRRERAIRTAAGADGGGMGYRAEFHAGECCPFGDGHISTRSFRHSSSMSSFTPYSSHFSINSGIVRYTRFNHGTGAQYWGHPCTLRRYVWNRHGSGQQATQFCH
jgi:hypothetical protein